MKNEILLRASLPVFTLPRKLLLVSVSGDDAEKGLNHCSYRNPVVMFLYSHILKSIILAIHGVIWQTNQVFEYFTLKRSNKKGEALQRSNWQIRKMKDKQTGDQQINKEME